MDGKVGSAGTIASTWLVCCLPIQSLDKLRKSGSQCSVKVLASAHVFGGGGGAQDRFSDGSLKLIEGATQVLQNKSLYCISDKHYIDYIIEFLCAVFDFYNCLPTISK